MWQRILEPELGALELVVRVAAVFVGLIVLLRLAGKRQLGQLGATEFVIMLLVSEVLQSAMVGGDESLPTGLAAAALLLGLGVLVASLTWRSKTMSRLLEGRPVRLVHDGKIIRRNMDRERLGDIDLKVMLRKNGVHRFENIDEVILEADGALSVTTRDEEEHRFPEASEEEARPFV
jgi:uncharacterized membrane protein YcaP (DUF421 family)